MYSNRIQCLVPLTVIIIYFCHIKYLKINDFLLEKRFLVSSGYLEILIENDTDLSDCI